MNGAAGINAGIGLMIDSGMTKGFPGRRRRCDPSYRVREGGPGCALHSGRTPSLPARDADEHADGKLGLRACSELEISKV